MKFFPLSRASQLTGAAVRRHLRETFARWGLPKALRIDNGAPWATQSDVPSALALWLIGLGIKVLVNRPRQSTDNGIVERNHGVLANWVEAKEAPSLEAFARQLSWASQMQREVYPAIGAKNRLEAYPGLQKNERTYQVERETELWQIQRVETYLATKLWARRVDKVGRISLFSSDYSVGRKYRGQTLQIRYDLQSHDWLIENEQGLLLKRYPCQEISLENIQNLSLAKRAKRLSHDTG